MGLYTSYPGKIDSSTELPVSTDLVTPVKSEVTNRLREAILAVEAELGVDPSGTYSTVKARLDALQGIVATDYADLLARIEALQPGGDVDLPTGSTLTPSKIRVFRGSTQSNATVNTNLTVIWSGGTSSLLASQNASLTGGQTVLSVTQAGTFQISGQLTLSPSVDAVNSIIVEVLNNGSVVETIQDNNTVWGIGLSRVFQFRVSLDLLITDQLTVRWRHGGSGSSATQLAGSDTQSWISLIRTN